MARPPLTRREGAVFAWTLAAGFAVVSAVAAMRGNPGIALTTGTLAGAALLAGTLVPTRLGVVRAAWMRVGTTIGVVTTPIVLGVIYFVVIAPTKRLFRRTPRRPQSYWVARGSPRDPASLHRQF